MNEPTEEMHKRAEAWQRHACRPEQWPLSQKKAHLAGQADHCAETVRKLRARAGLQWQVYMARALHAAADALEAGKL